jgi:rhamnose transport system permease protein
MSATLRLGRPHDRAAAAFERLLARRELALAVLLVALVVVISVRAPEYVVPRNLINVLVGASVLCILVVGQLFVLLVRGVDLSTAANLGYSGMILAMVSHARPELPAVAFILLGAAIGLVLGAVNGVLVAAMRVPPIICTLGTMVIYRGLIFLLSRGAWVHAHEMSEPFKSFPLGAWLGLPNIVLVAIVVAAAAWYFLGYTATGRSIYAVGGNPLAATFAGLSVARVELLVFTLAGVLSGISGYLWTARFAIATPQAAEGREFAIIAACVIGGVSIAGGRGTVPGVILGALFITVIESALPFVRVSPFLQTAISGTVILIAVAVNARGERRPGRQILEVRAAERKPAARLQASPQ